MKKFYKLLFCLLMVIVLTDIPLSSQSARILNINTQYYPEISLWYRLFDANNTEIRNIGKSDIELTENGTIRTIKDTYPECPAGSECFSAILVLDNSASMADNQIRPGGPSRREAAILAAKEFIDNFDSTLSEFAIIVFSGSAKILIPFSRNKDSLLKALYNYDFGVGTNYNAAFLCDWMGDSTQSALYLAQFAHCKPIMVFLTDGEHNTEWGDTPGNPDGDFLLLDVVTKARSEDARVFIIKIGDDALADTLKNQLTTLAQIEGNVSDNLFYDITNENDLKSIYHDISRLGAEVGYPAPCEIRWDTDCNGGGDVILTFPNHGNVSASSTLVIPESYKPQLAIVPRDIVIENLAPPATRDYTITVTSQNNWTDIANPGFTQSDPRFSIVDWGGKTLPFRLNKDESITVTLRYTPDGSAFTGATGQFLGSACSGSEINFKTPTAIEDGKPLGNVRLMAPNPNPADGQALIQYELMRESTARLYIVNILGTEVTELFDGIASAGTHKFIFDSSELPPGAYFIVLKTPAETVSTKMCVIK